jgi:hypothetical protein
MARSFSTTDGLNQGIRRESVRRRDPASPRFRVAKNVPVLRINHAALKDFLPRVRQVAGASNKIVNFQGQLIFGDPQMRLGDQYALDNFRGASDSVAARL